MRIIEWSDDHSRTIYLCDDHGIPLESLDKAPVGDFSYTAYIMWDQMATYRHDWTQKYLESEPSILNTLIDEAKTQIRKYFDERRSERRREIIEQWKRDETYPYVEIPLTPEEEIEQATFDVLATAVHSAVPKPRKQQRLTLALLKETLRQHPDNLTDLLDQYLFLKPDEREQLEHLLRDIGLSKIIRATTNVNDRFRFLRALELMIDDPEANQLIGERNHLHKIMEHELWVFGERFNSMISERGLTTVRDKHRSLLGLEPVHGVVRRDDGTLGRVDLLLSASARETGRNRHLVVELKAPRVSAGTTELTQVESYALAVARDPHFGGVQTMWEFWLVTTTVEESIRLQTRQVNHEPGMVMTIPIEDGFGSTVSVWVRTWGEIIEDNRQRLTYYQEHLQSDPTLDDAKAYLTERYPSVVPEAFLRTDS